MTTTVNIYDAKTHLSRLVDQAAAGEDIVIARAGKPMVRLVPVEQKAARQPGGLEHLHLPDEFFDPLSEDELKLWE
jgi:prevent-host-death family protein